MNTAAVTSLKVEEFHDFIAERGGLTLVDFWAPWCGPCKTVAPVLERLAGKFHEVLRIGKVNVDEAGDLAAQFDVRSIPTLILFRDGKPLSKTVGAQSDDALREWIGQYAAPATSRTSG